jgi:hypothetical protein
VTLLATTARHSHNVLNPHPAGKQCHCQEETDNEKWDHHNHPGQRLEAPKAQCLEHAGAEHGNH